MTYRTNREDFESLERITELHDQVALDESRLALMQEPTKAKASSMYASGIDLWFREHGILEGSEEIAARHGIPAL